MKRVNISEVRTGPKMKWLEPDDDVHWSTCGKFFIQDYGDVFHVYRAIGGALVGRNISTLRKAKWRADRVAYEDAIELKKLVEGGHG